MIRCFRVITLLGLVLASSLASVAVNVSNAVANTATASAISAACYVPPDLLPSVHLSRVKAVRKANEPLRILVVGSGSTSGSSLGGADRAYPARLKQWLESRWGSAAVIVITRAEANRTAEQITTQLSDWVQESRPQLIIWQTGTVDALRGVDLDAFGETLLRGMRISAAAGANVVLINAQFGSAALRARPIEPYHQYMAQIARAEDALLFRRYEIMQYWVDEGQLNISHTVRAEQLRAAEQVHNCIGQLLAETIDRGAR